MQKPRKLALHTETVRRLTSTQLSRAAGGLPSGVPWTDAHSDACPGTTAGCSTRCDVTVYCPDTGFTCTF